MLHIYIFPSCSSYQISLCGENDRVDIFLFSSIREPICEELKDEKAVEWGKKVEGGVFNNRIKSLPIIEYKELLPFSADTLSFSNKDKISYKDGIITLNDPNGLETCLLGDGISEV